MKDQLFVFFRSFKYLLLFNFRSFYHESIESIFYHFFSKEDTPWIYLPVYSHSEDLFDSGRC